jgi:arylsulfatase A-like enzyme
MHDGVAANREGGGRLVREMRQHNPTKNLASRRDWLAGAAASAVFASLPASAAGASERPNFVLCMADDQGWGDVGFRGHPVLKTPVLDEMAASGLRFERFYAAAPVCSPTRGSVLTGRHPNRYGCFSWGHTIRPQELTIAEALRSAGYATGHFGKWHLGPVRADSPVCPGASGFDEWMSSPNFFENDPLMSHNGEVIQTRGEGSQVTVVAARKQPFLAVVWFGSPHAPHQALENDRRPYRNQPERLQHFYGEITAMDRAIGSLREGIRRLGIRENTLLWYNSDNGAIPVGSTGGLSGGKGTLNEGGIRVPAMIEWPARIRKPRTEFTPCGTVDIYPTLLEAAGARVEKQVRPLDGISLAALIGGRISRRKEPMGFWVYPEGGIAVQSQRLLEDLAAEQSGKTPRSAAPPDPGIIGRRYPEEQLPGAAAWIDGHYKLLRPASKDGAAASSLFHLDRDPQEKSDLAGREPQRAARMESELKAWQRSVVRSLNGDDYR